MVELIVSVLINDVDVVVKVCLFESDEIGQMCWGQMLILYFWFVQNVDLLEVVCEQGVIVIVMDMVLCILCV